MPQPGAEMPFLLRILRSGFLRKPRLGCGRTGNGSRAPTCPAEQRPAILVKMKEAEQNKYLITDTFENHPNCFITGCRDTQSDGNYRLPDVCTARSFVSGVCGVHWLEGLHQMSGDFICRAQTLSRVLHVEIAEGHVIECR